MSCCSHDRDNRLVPFRAGTRVFIGVRMARRQSRLIRTLLCHWHDLASSRTASLRRSAAHVENNTLKFIKRRTWFAIRHVVLAAVHSRHGSQMAAIRVWRSQAGRTRSLSCCIQILARSLVQKAMHRWGSCVEHWALVRAALIRMATLRARTALWCGYYRWLYQAHQSRLSIEASMRSFEHYFRHLLRRHFVRWHTRHRCALGAQHVFRAWVTFGTRCAFAVLTFNLKVSNELRAYRALVTRWGKRRRERWRARIQKRCFECLLFRVTCQKNEKHLADCVRRRVRQTRAQVLLATWRLAWVRTVNAGFSASASARDSEMRTLADATAQISESEQRVHKLEHAISPLQQQICAYQTELAETQARAGWLQQKLSERGSRTAELRHAHPPLLPPRARIVFAPPHF